MIGRRQGEGITRCHRPAVVLVGALLAGLLPFVVAPRAGAQTVTRIMPLGDSITAGVGSDPNDGGYRTYLEDLQVADGHQFDFVGSVQKGPGSLADKDNEGHGGYKISDIAGNVNTWLSQFSPDIVLLMIGTNDIRHDSDPAGAGNRLSALLDQMANARPSAQIIVSTIPPQTDLSDAARRQALVDYNNAIPGIVSAKASAGRKISMVDAFRVLTNSDILDGQHPTQLGDSKIANVWYGALTKVLPVPSSGVRYLSDLNPTAATSGYGPYERDRTNGGPAQGDGGLLRLGGAFYAKGLGVVPTSSITYNLGGAYSSFAATVGADDVVAPNGSVTFQVFLDDVKVYESGVLRGGGAPATVSQTTSGKTTLRLVVTDAGDGSNYDHADWVNARVVQGGGGTTTPPTTTGPTTTGPTTTGPTTTRPPTTVPPTTGPTTTAPGGGSITYVSNLDPTAASNGYGPYERDRSNGGPAQGDGYALQMHNVLYPKGLGVVPTSSITYNLGGAYTTFLADVGVDDVAAPNGSVVFQVFVDNVKVYDSGTVTWNNGPKAVSVNVAGKSTLRLAVGDAGDGTNWDQADWGGARLQGSGGGGTTTPPTTTTPTTTGPTTTGPTTTRPSTTVPPTTGPTTTAPGGGSITYVSNLDPTAASNGYGPYERDRSNGGPAQGDGFALQMHNVLYPKGLGVVPTSSITYNLGGAYTTFLADVGVDDVAAPNGSVVFQVFVDNVKVYDSGTVTWNNGPKAVSVNVAGKSTLRLAVGDAGDGTNWDQADWGGARLLR